MTDSEIVSKILKKLCELGVWNTPLNTAYWLIIDEDDIKVDIAQKRRIIELLKAAVNQLISN